MKYLPLVWAAVIRKPAEMILVRLAVATSFALFGLMIGVHTTYLRIIAATRPDAFW